MVKLFIRLRIRRKYVHVNAARHYRTKSRILYARRIRAILYVYIFLETISIMVAIIVTENGNIAMTIIIRKHLGHSSESKTDNFRNGPKTIKRKECLVRARKTRPRLYLMAEGKVVGRLAAPAE